MGFCPKCKYEYKREIYQCPDCNVDLVSHLPPDDSNATNSHPDAKAGFRPLPPVLNPIFAEMVKGALEKEGIPCYIMIEGVGNALRYAGTEGHGKRIEVFVPVEKYEESAAIQKSLVDEA